MNETVLVTYASRTDATADTAVAIGKFLSGKGITAAVKPMADVQALGGYQAVVAGSAIQNRQWLPEAVDFVRSYRSELNQMPFAIFTLCMTLAMKNGENYRADVNQWISPVRQIARPASEGLFAGVLDISKIPSWGDRLKFRISVLTGVWSEGDHRDWEAIRTWAEGLPETFS